MDEVAGMPPLPFGPAPRVIALDLDGVVYAGDSPLPGAAAALNELRAGGRSLFFVTNNSGRDRKGIASKLAAMGIHASPEEVITSGYAACALMERLDPGRGSTVLVIGTPELAGELARAGFAPVDRGRCDYLVVGLDPGFSYGKIALALEALGQGATFIACNRDRSYPAGGGRLLPGCGPLVAAVEWAWGRPAHHDAGKPGTWMLEMVSEATGACPEEILVVGDSLESDIAMARRFGSPAVLVAPGGCAGVSGEEAVALVVDSLPALLDRVPA